MITLLLALSCAQDPAPELDAAARATRFAFALYPQLLRMSKDKNLVVSPLSLTLAMSMAHAGAGGATREEMTKALEWTGLTAEDVDVRCGALAAALRGADPSVKLEIANSAWARRDFPFHAAYVGLLRERYGALAEAVSFDAAGAARINGWVKENTGGKIESIVPDPIPGDSVLFLLNAVYFKGAWKHVFDPKLTQEQPFHPASGPAKPLPFMTRTAHFGHLETSAFRAIRIPYGAGERLACYVFVPTGTVTLADFHLQLGAGAWEGWMSRFKPRELRLELPRFKLSGELKLNRPLAALGMSRAFGAGADFTRMSPAGGMLYISEVLQKTFLELNEEGTEAAAVTSVRVGVTSVPRPPAPFKVDRPFFLALRDDKTGAILFMGSIVDP